MKNEVKVTALDEYKASESLSNSFHLISFCTEGELNDRWIRIFNESINSYTQNDIIKTAYIKDRNIYIKAKPSSISQKEVDDLKYIIKKTNDIYENTFDRTIQIPLVSEIEEFRRLKETLKF